MLSGRVHTLSPAGQVDLESIVDETRKEKESARTKRVEFTQAVQYVRLCPLSTRKTKLKS